MSVKVQEEVVRKWSYLDESPYKDELMLYAEWTVGQPLVRIRGQYLCKRALIELGRWLESQQ
jgi:hypothetical protein